MPEGMAQAVAAALEPPGGVATYILPSDYQAEDAQAGGAGPSTAAASSAVPAAVPVDRIEAAARRLSAAGKRGVLFLGGDSLGAAGQVAAARVAATTQAEVHVETFPARWERGAERPPFSRLPYFPEQARAALAEAEVVVLVGACAPVSFFGYPGQPSSLAPEGSSLLLAGPGEDASRALEDLADALAAPRGRGPASTRRSCDPPRGRLDTSTVGAALALCLPENAIVVEEAATSSLGFYASSLGAPQHTVLTLTGGAIGQGPPVSTGAAIACPGRKIISFQADGSAAYTLQALWTQAREGLDVVTLLCSNRAYRILQVELARSGVEEPGPKARALTQLEEPALDWVSLAAGFGVKAMRVETAEALMQTLPRALAEGGPQLIELALH
jgi:acetolactate synthase-1/2/3 large subunit